MMLVTRVSTTLFQLLADGAHFVTGTSIIRKMSRFVSALAGLVNVGDFVQQCANLLVYAYS
jgi:hypothetical protein